MDLLLRNGTVIDGTGRPRRSADVGVADGPDRRPSARSPHRRRREVRRPRRPRARPRLHRHPHPLRRPGPVGPATSRRRRWHGVTSVVMGNCGFGDRPDPARAPRRPSCARSRTSRACRSTRSRPGIDWTFETFPEYLDALDAPPQAAQRRRAASATPPLRLYVLGDEATEREATEDEVGDDARHRRARRSRPARSGSRRRGSPAHSGAYGQPGAQPPRRPDDEIYALAAALGELRQGRDPGRRSGPACSSTSSPSWPQRIGRPSSWTALMAAGDSPARRSRDRRRAAAARRARCTRRSPAGRSSCRSRMTDPFPFAEMAAVRRRSSAVPRDERAALYRGRGVARAGRGRPLEAGATAGRRRPSRRRDAPRATWSDGPTARPSWPPSAGIDALRPDARPRARGRPGHPLPHRAGQRRRGRDRRPARRRAHRCSACPTPAPTPASSATPASRPTCSAYWVPRARGAHPGAGRVAAHRPPAEVFRLRGPGPHRRGLPRPTWSRSTPTRSAPSPVERVRDLPGGADRLIARSPGVEHVWVNGTAIRREGEDLDARPGALLRGAP